MVTVDPKQFSFDYEHFHLFMHIVFPRPMWQLSSKGVRIGVIRQTVEECFEFLPKGETRPVAVYDTLEELLNSFPSDGQPKVEWKPALQVTNLAARISELSAKGK
jgi:hypothetical protein